MKTSMGRKIIGDSRRKEPKGAAKKQLKKVVKKKEE